jgi:signal transduction histidine kinase/ABC-type amino acid transport substrate-binding protein
MRKALYTIIVLAVWLLPSAVMASPLSERYTDLRPLVVAGDWDKPPYEFLNDDGKPAGTNVDVVRLLCKELGIPCRFELKEWSSALKAFERGDADIILANVKRYKKTPYVCTQNIINYNRICAAMVGDTTGVISHKELIRGGMAVKPGDFTALLFHDLDSAEAERVEQQPPKVALQGLLAGDYKYFVWGEEPLKWKIKELNLEGITLAEVHIPVSEIHIIGRDRDLIYELDDQYSRLKQSGEVQRINDRWLYPELVQTTTDPWLVYVMVAILLLAGVFYALGRIAQAHVKSATRDSSELTSMMQKALHMGNIHVLLYDIRRDLVLNHYGTPILPPEGLTLAAFTERIHPQERTEFQQKMNTLLSGRERKFELNKRWKACDNDSWLHLEGHAIVELDADGRPAYVINALNDITENIEKDHAIHNLDCKFRKLQAMPGVAMSFYDKGGWLIDINDAMRELCGISSDNPESKRFWLSVSMFDIPIFRSAYSPDDRHNLLACMHMDYPDMGIDTFVEYYIQPLFNAEGELANYFCSTIDLTEQRQLDHELHRLSALAHQAEKRIERYDNWLNFLTKQGNTYLWYSDVGKQTAYYYHSMRGQSPHDFIVMPFDVHVNHMPPADRQTALAHYNSPEPFDSIQHFNETVVGTGSSWFRISGTPITDAHGRFVGHRGMSVDVTREVVAKQQLDDETRIVSDIARLKSGFMASMTHELRTPLNAIMGFSGILPVIDSPDERAEYIRIIRNNCDMLERLISDILTASTLSDSSTSIQLANVDFAKAFDDICLTLQQRMHTPNVVFIHQNPYDHFHTKLDIERVQQVVTNLFTNAVKFTQQGHIKLGYSYVGAKTFAELTGHTAADPHAFGLFISCEDTGIGIPSDKQALVFERFVKLDEYSQGTGMGLAICKTIVESMQGEIGLSSQGTGRGTTAWVWIPCQHLLT